MMSWWRSYSVAQLVDYDDNVHTVLPIVGICGCTKCCPRKTYSPFADSSTRILIACLKAYTFNENFRVNTSIHVGFVRSWISNRTYDWLHPNMIYTKGTWKYSTLIDEKNHIRVTPDLWNKVMKGRRKSHSETLKTGRCQMTWTIS